MRLVSTLNNLIFTAVLMVSEQRLKVVISRATIFGCAKDLWIELCHESFVLLCYKLAP